jgi:hypothetical protein
MKLHVVGIDLGKTVFHLVGLDSTGKVVIRKKCSRTQLLAFTANLQVQPSFALYRAGQGTQQGHGGGRGRAEPARSETPSIAAALVDLGPRAGDGQAQELHGGHECESVLL